MFDNEAAEVSRENVSGRDDKECGHEDKELAQQVRLGCLNLNRREITCSNVCGNGNGGDGLQKHEGERGELDQEAMASE